MSDFNRFEIVRNSYIIPATKIHPADRLAPYGHADADGINGCLMGLFI